MDFEFPQFIVYPGYAYTFPSGINAPVSYGPNVEATIAYMHTRQFIINLASVEHSFGEVGTMGKGLVNKGCFKVFEEQIQGESRFIPNWELVHP